MSIHLERNAELLKADLRNMCEQAASVPVYLGFSSMSCVYFLCDVFWAFNVHICLYFDLAAGGYSGEIQELVSVKTVLDILLTNFGVGFFLVVFFLDGVGWLVGFWGFLVGFFLLLLHIFISLTTFTDS